MGLQIVPTNRIPGQSTPGDGADLMLNQIFSYCEPQYTIPSRKESAMFYASDIRFVYRSNQFSHRYSHRKLSPH